MPEFRLEATCFTSSRSRSRVALGAVGARTSGRATRCHTELLVASRRLCCRIRARPVNRTTAGLLAAVALVLAGWLATSGIGDNDTGAPTDGGGPCERGGVWRGAAAASSGAGGGARAGF